MIFGGFVFYHVNEYGCIGFRSFKDTNTGLDFRVDCRWEIIQNVDIDEDEYLVSIRHKSAEINLKMIEPEDEVELQDGDRFLELNNGEKRFREEESSTYFYTGIDRLSDKEFFQISATPNEESIRYIDSIVLSLIK